MKAVWNAAKAAVGGALLLRAAKGAEAAVSRVVREAPDVGRAALRTLNEDLREFKEHLRDVRAGK